MPAAAAFVIDLVLVGVFVLIGRASHGEDALGILNTLWPFAAGLVVGWAALRAWRAPRRVLWTGIGVWAITVGVGMLLRVAAGQGVRPSFVVVAAVVTAGFLLGWRGIAAVVVRQRQNRMRGPAGPRSLMRTGGPFVAPRARSSHGRQIP